ncbi:MAG: uncharacterized protein JWN65_1812 [Solirubrobacterales bacterium]|nr:uncharacterized protein [Solirubrobacterales bacterium]
MTAFLIRTMARQPTGVLVRPSAAFVLALILTYATGAWVILLHAAEGGHEANEPGFVTHWLRDSTLALPLVFCAVWGGLLLARTLLHRTRTEHHHGFGAVVCATSVGLAVAVVTAVMSPLHAGLFQAHHGGHELPFLVHVLRDAALSLTVDLPLALIVVATLVHRGARPWTVPIIDRWAAPSGPVRRLGLQAALALVVVVPVLIFGSQQAQVAVAVAPAGAPCAEGAPVKRFDVRAIRVDIPLNRFGDHDPQGWMYALAADIPAVREQERTRHVSLGLRDDAIQPLVLRANRGDCVEIAFQNDAAGEVGMHVDGLAYEVASSGDAVGRNLPSSATQGEQRTYRFYVPDDEGIEGNHYIRPGPGNRDAVSHGLFGSLTVEPKGSTYLHPDTREPVQSGWEAIIVPGTGKAFREYVNIYHEVGDEDYRIPTAGGVLPLVDPITTSYRPSARAMNYRSEPFMHRLQRDARHKAQSYNSYTFGDPATPMPRAYLGDPSKIRILHAGSEVFHVYHLHGGGIRWRMDPVGDKTFDYGDTGLNKHPAVARSTSSRLDSQNFGPGEAYDLEIEGGAGGVQQSAGDFLFHCHIVEHYVSGMWSFWRVFDTRQADLAPLPDRQALPPAVDSTGLVGRTMPDGTTLTRDDLDAWIRPQLPPPGAPLDAMDGAVWDWQIQASGAGPLYLGAPEEKGAWPNLPGAQDKHTLPGHPGLRIGDEPVGAQDRPKILFNPRNGRPAFPLLRPHIGQRPPFSSNGHSGAPYLGERGGEAGGAGPKPWAGRDDGICPAGAPQRNLNIVSVQKPIQVTRNSTDPNGKIFVLAKNVADVRSGTKPSEPLVMRANVGDCVAVTLSSEQEDNLEQPFAMTNLHIHHVQFDVQASDGVGTGLQYGQAVRPFKAEDPSLAAAAATGDRVLRLAQVPAKLRPGVWVGIGMGTESIEVRQIESVDAAAAQPTVTLTAPLAHDHAAGQAAGTEFIQYRWYPDVQLDNVFFHDHVDGIHNWGHGLVGQLIVEPPGSTYHDPRTGAEIDSGSIADIHTSNPLVPGVVDGAFREVALTNINSNAANDSTVNLRAEPWSDRLTANPDPSLLFSSYTHGDPFTPLPRAYRGDPVVIRTINASPTVDAFRLQGHRFVREPGRTDPAGGSRGTFTDTLRQGVSERWTAILEGGAGNGEAGDFLYHDGVGRRFRQGAWGLLRVLGGRADDLKPLPGRAAPTAPAAPAAQTGGRPPDSKAPGNPCPADARQQKVAVSAVDLPGTVPGRGAAFVPTEHADAVRSGARAAEPLALHVAAGTCLTVDFTNSRATERASMQIGELVGSVRSSGINAGFGVEQTVAPSASRQYRWYADTKRIGSAAIGDFGGLDSGADGLYGIAVVAPAGATFSDPVTGAPTVTGTQIDVTVPGGQSYRDFSAIFADNDAEIGGDTMPYPQEIAPEKAALLGYQGERRVQDASTFSSRTHEDPPTAMLRAYAGDPVRIHALVAPGSQQPHVFSAGGHNWPLDPEVAEGGRRHTAGIGPWETRDLHLDGGAGGYARARGDFFYGDLRRPFTNAGLWGLIRVISDERCPIKPLSGGDCLGKDPLAPGAPAVRPGTAPTQRPANTIGGSGGTTATTPPAPVPAGKKAKPRVKRAVKRNLRIPSKLTLGAFERSGVTMRLYAPKGTRVLQVRLLRVASPRPLTTTILAIRSGGKVRIRFAPDARTLRTLKPGTYMLAVRTGPSSKRLSSKTLRAAFRLLPAAPPHLR